MEFYDVDPKEISLQPMDIFATDWALLTAGTAESWNTMTIGWGGLGTLWSQPMATVYVRPDRHTHGFMEESDRFTISFFGEDDREKLNFCGAHSGRDTDKTACGITPMEVDDGAIAFEDAELIISCRKVYSTDFEAEKLLDEAILSSRYPGETPLHTAYWGVIEHVYVAESILDDEDECGCDDDGCGCEHHHHNDEEA